MKLAALLEDPALHKIYVRIVPANIVLPTDRPQDIAFRFFVEQVDAFLAGHKQKGMLLGDRDEEFVDVAVTSVDRCKRLRTPWARGRRILHVIDTPYFAHSHHSRLIQLADTYAYLLQLYASADTASGFRERVRLHLRTQTALATYAQKKIWPPSAMVW